MNKTQVLIIGAGPTGLVLALYLTKLGIKVRIIDQAAEPGTTSRALVVHARTLEFYRWLGIADEVISRGAKANAVRLWVAGKQATRVNIGAIGAGLSPFPYLLFFPQDEHERLLIEALAKLGISVEREKQFLDFREEGKEIIAKFKTLNGEESIQAEFIAGCDGARSRMRELLHTGFPGSTYNDLFYVADVAASGPAINGELNVALDDADFLAVFPMKGEGRVRLIGTVEANSEQERKLEWSDVQHSAINHLKMKIEKINWFSTYRVHHRVTEHTRKGRAFLLGDAAHIHSPVGGQGMNTGIGDAINLGWKLAMVLKNQAPDSLLDTYEVERIAFARRLVKTVDRAFTFVTKDGSIARRVRLNIVPILLPIFFKLHAMRMFMFRNVSQIAIHYRMSKLSEGRAGEIQGGDRMPWVKFADGTDNFAGIGGVSWQVHVYGKENEAFRNSCSEYRLPLQVFSWSAVTGMAGLTEGAAYLIRPDGYIGFVGQERAGLESYLRKQEMTFVSGP